MSSTVLHMPPEADITAVLVMTAVWEGTTSPAAAVAIFRRENVDLTADGVRLISALRPKRSGGRLHFVQAAEEIFGWNRERVIVALQAARAAGLIEGGPPRD